MEIKSFTNNDLKMKYMRFGNPDGRTFVVLPGLSLRSVLLAAPAIEGAYKAFTDDYDIYLFDRKDDIEGRYTVEEMADDTAAAMRELGIRDAVVMGFSQGGMMAQVIAVKNKDLVGKLVLGSTTPRLRQKETDMILGWASLAKEGDLRKLVDNFGQNVYSDGFYSKYKDMIYTANKDATEEDISRFIALSEGTEGFDIYGRIGEIEAKTLVLADRKDKIISAEAYDDFDKIPVVTKYLYDEFGHAVYDEAPDFFDRVIRFMNSDK